jgi:hypothetical protein
MEFVKNRSSLFQRQIPETFKRMLIQVVPQNLNALVSAENGEFLRSNGVITQQNLDNVLNQTRLSNEIPMEKISHFLTQLRRMSPTTTQWSQTIPGAIIQSLKDSSRGGVLKLWPESKKYWLHFLRVYLQQTDIRNMNRVDFRMKGNQGNDLGTIASRNFEIISELKNAMDYMPNDELNRFIKEFNNLNNGASGFFNSELMDTQLYNRGFAFRQATSGLAKTERDRINAINQKKLHAASRKSADLSMGPQGFASHGNLIPKSFNNFLVQSGHSSGLDECAFVVFADNQCYSNGIGNCGYSSLLSMGIRRNKGLDWGLGTLLQEFDPNLWADICNGVTHSPTFHESEKPKMILEEGESQHYIDYSRYQERIIKFKGFKVWWWNPSLDSREYSRKFYENMYYEVQLTWNFQTNYVHYQVVNSQIYFTNHQVFFKEDPHLPKLSAVGL